MKSNNNEVDIHYIEFLKNTIKEKEAQIRKLEREKATLEIENKRLINKVANEITDIICNMLTDEFRRNRIVKPVSDDTISDDTISDDTVSDDTNPEMISISEAAKQIKGTSEITIRQLIKRGEIKASRIGKGEKAKYIINKRELLDYFSANSDDTNPEMISIEEAAKQIKGLSTYTIRQLIKRGEIKACLLGKGVKNGKYVINKRSLLDYFSANPNDIK